MITTIIVSVLGIASTLIAYYLNPKRKFYAEIDDIDKKIKEMENARDKALKDNDSDTLTIITNDLNELRARKTVLLQRGL